MYDENSNEWIFITSELNVITKFKNFLDVYEILVTRILTHAELIKKFSNIYEDDVKAMTIRKVILKKKVFR